MEPLRTPRRTIFLAALWVGVLAGVVLSLHQARQAQLDNTLLTAIQLNDRETAVSALEDGANANAEEWIGPPASLGLALHDARFWLHGRRPPSRGFFAPALALIYAGQPRPRGFGRVGSISPRIGAPWGRPENVPLVKALLEHGADPNFHPGGSGPLYTAVRMGHRETVRLLLKHGADPNVKDEAASVPLTYADIDCARLLIEHRANVNRAGYLGMTPLMTAAANSGRDGADKIALLLRHGADANARDAYGQTALMHAVNVPAARLLLQFHADIDAGDRFGTTALMMDCANYSDPELAPFLVRQGARVSGADSHGKSALDYARARNKTALCGLLSRAEKGGVVLKFWQRVINQGP